MDRLPEFIANHWLLSTAFVFLLTLLIVTESRRGGRSLSPALLGAVVNRDNGVLLDVRADSDFRAGHIGGSIQVPATQLATRLTELEKYKGRPIIVVCAQGPVSGDVAKQLIKAGHAPVYRLAGGIAAWRNENLPVVKA
ncbi:MAG: rhodanese-like domain-containing protein [Pseudomonadota bacterium]